MEDAEARYNLGMSFYRLKAMQEGDLHFIKAANLVPGNKVILNWSPLAGMSVPEKESKRPGSNRPDHSH